jgi:hypothetical protein
MVFGKEWEFKEVSIYLDSSFDRYIDVDDVGLIHPVIPVAERFEAE